MAPATDPGRWPVWRLALLLYPFVTGAVAINLFMAGLLMQFLGWMPLTPVAALLWSLPLGVPFAFAFGVWVRRLMDAADAGD